MDFLKIKEFTVIKDLNLPFSTSIECCEISSRKTFFIEHDLIVNKNDNKIYVSEKVFNKLKNDILITNIKY